MAITFADHGRLSFGESSFSHLLARVERYELAFPIESIRAVHEAPLVNPVPASPNILGAVNLHGEAIPVLDLRKMMRVSSKPVAYEDRLLLLRAGGRTVGVVVDEIRTLIDLPNVDPQSLDPLFGETPINRQLISGMVCAPDLIAVVNVAGLAVPDTWDDEALQAGFPDAGQSLLFESLDAGHPLAMRTAALAAPIEQPTTKGIDAAAFVLSGQHFAVPLAAVHSFFRDAPHSLLPCRARIPTSLLNFRGEALALYDIKPLLGLGAGGLAERVDGMVVTERGCKVAIAVDSIAGLESLGTPAACAAKPGDYCLSVHAGNGGSVQLLDVTALVSAADLRLMSEGPK